MGFCDPAPDEDKHLRVRFLWHGRPYTATLADKVNSFCTSRLVVVPCTRHQPFGTAAHYHQITSILYMEDVEEYFTRHAEVRFSLAVMSTARIRSIHA